MQTANETNTVNVSKTTNPDNNLTEATKHFLSVVYKKSFLNKLLTHPEEGYTLVGLLFSELYSRDFEIDLLYVNSSNTSDYKKIPAKSTDLINSAEDQINKKENVFVEYYFNNTNEISNNGNEASRFREHPDMVKVVDKVKWELIEPEKQIEIQKNSILQFWNVVDKKENEKYTPLAFISKIDLDFLLERNDVDRICISGANIDYGTGFYNFEKEKLEEKRKTRYPTLKAEINPDAKTVKNKMPKVAIALPCPAAWDVSFQSAFINEVVRNYVKFNNKIDQKIEEVIDKPRSIVPEPKNIFDKLATNWNAFLENN